MDLRAILLLKVYFLLALLGLVGINYSNSKKWSEVNSFPVNHGLIFYYENLLIGIASGSSTAIIAFLRNKDLNSILFYFIATFIIIIIINLLFQYSGLYYFFYNEPTFFKNDSLYLEVNGVILLILLIASIIGSFYKKQYIIGFFNKKINHRIIEIVVFMLAYTIPFFYIDKNRTGKLTSQDIGEIIYFMLSFLFLYLILEFSGFWNSLGLGLT